MTPEEQEDLAAAAGAVNWHGRVRLLSPLPRRVRFRLWRRSMIDRAGTWLVVHDHARAAQRLWRACGMLDARKERR